MGGPGSGRWREGAAKPPQRRSHDARRQHRRQIAEYAVQHGVRAAMGQFNVSDASVYRALRSNRLHPAKDSNHKVGVSAIKILKRMLLDHETADEAAVALRVTVTYARAVQREAAAAGFTFGEKLRDNGHGANAAETDGGERGESPAVGCVFYRDS